MSTALTKKNAKSDPAKQVVAVGPRVLGSFLDKIGGAEAFGELIFEDYERTRIKAIEKNGEDNVVEKRLQTYTKDLITKLVDIDRFHHETGEFDDVSDADLAALLMEEAIEKITSNPLFATKMLTVIRDNQPSIFQQLVVTGEVPTAQGVIDVTVDATGSATEDEIPDDLLALAGPADDPAEEGSKQPAEQNGNGELPASLFGAEPIDENPADPSEEFAWPTA